VKSLLVRVANALRAWPWVTATLLAMNLALFMLFNHRDADREQRLAERGVVALVYFEQHPYLTLKSPLSDFLEPSRTLASSLSAPAANLADFSSFAGLPAQVVSPSDNVIVRRQQAELDAKVGAFAEIADQWQASSLGYVPQTHAWWSSITYQFTHGSWWHLMGNIWFLWLVGRRLERAWGRTLLAMFYVTAGVAAAVAHQLAAWQSVVPLVGASGAIAGLLGAFALHEVGAIRVNSRLPISRMLVPLLLMAWFAFELVQASFFPRREGSTSHFAHVGGFTFGFFCAWLLTLQHHTRQRQYS